MLTPTASATLLPRDRGHNFRAKEKYGPISMRQQYGAGNKIPADLTTLARRLNV